MQFLVLGDIVGRPGRRVVRELLPALLKEFTPDLVIANGENAAGGNGITRKVAEELFAAGIDFLTMGNHVWDQKEGEQLLAEDPRLIRPANYPAGAPGRGHALVTTRRGLPVGVINLSGQVYMPNLDSPFHLVKPLIAELNGQTRVILVDFHAEATSEKEALGWYLDGRVSALWGTHTHVQTADARVLPGGTAYITDLGMTGPRDSILGIEREVVIRKFVTKLPVRFEVAKGGVAQLEGAVITVDESTGQAQSIQAIHRELP